MYTQTYSSSKSTPGIYATRNFLLLKRLVTESGFESQLRIFSVGFEVFKAVTMKNAVFWDEASCELIINRRFGGTCRLHLQGRRDNARKEKCQTVSKSTVPLKARNVHIQQMLGRVPTQLHKS
jgi:hypothetical protein